MAYLPSSIIGRVGVCFSETLATVAFWNTDTSCWLMTLGASGNSWRYYCSYYALIALSYCIFCSCYLCSSNFLYRSYCSCCSFCFLKFSCCFFLSCASFFSFSFYLRSSSFCLSKDWRVWREDSISRSYSAMRSSLRLTARSILSRSIWNYSSRPFLSSMACLLVRKMSLRRSLSWIKEFITFCKEQSSSLWSTEECCMSRIVSNWAIFVSLRFLSSLIFRLYRSSSWSKSSSVASVIVSVSP